MFSAGLIAGYACARIARLPALFGRGLKKNVIFDLLNDNQVDKINLAASFQWYPVDRLWDDIEVVRVRDLSLVNLFTEPLGTQRIVDGYFPGAPVGPARTPAATHRLCTRYAEEFGGRDSRAGRSPRRRRRPAPHLSPTARR